MDTAISLVFVALALFLWLVVAFLACHGELPLSPTSALRRSERPILFWTVILAALGFLTFIVVEHSLPLLHTASQHRVVQ